MPASTAMDSHWPLVAPQTVPVPQVPQSQPLTVPQVRLPQTWPQLQIAEPRQVWVALSQVQLAAQVPQELPQLSKSQVLLPQSCVQLTQVVVALSHFWLAVQHSLPHCFVQTLHWPAAWSQYSLATQQAEPQRGLPLGQPCSTHWPLASQSDPALQVPQSHLPATTPQWRPAQADAQVGHCWLASQ